jgi:hypothetical protein
MKIKSTAIPCHITDSERKALNAVASQFGFHNISEFTRYCIMEKCESELRRAEAFLLHTVDPENSKSIVTVQD